MSERTSQRLVLDINSGSQPINGRLTVEGRTPVEFAGWMGLAAALERLLEPVSSSRSATDYER